MAHEHKEAPKGSDGAVYYREQKGHSLTLWILLSFAMIGIPWLIYYSVSKNHYWHF